MKANKNKLIVFGTETGRMISKQSNCLEIERPSELKKFDDTFQYIEAQANISIIAYEPVNINKQDVKTN